MAIQVGEVQALLSVRDNMSSAITQVTQRIAELKAEMVELGQSSGSTFDALNAQLQSNQVILGDLQANLAGVNQSIITTGDNFATTGGQMDQMDRIATRLVERLLVFYALKETFSFTVGLFEAAAATVELSDQLDLSLGKIQELQYAAQQTDTPFTKVTSSIDAFNKKLAELKPATVDALSQLHLSFDQVFSLNPDQRLDLITSALAAIPDHLQRVRLEAALFGGDIDQLITKLPELEKQARSAGAVLGDDNVKQLAAADKSFKELYETIKILASTFIVAEQNAVAFVTAPLFTDASIWQKIVTYSAMLTNPSGGVAYNKAMGISTTTTPAPSSESPSPFANLPPATSAPLYGADYVEMIREQSMAVKDLTTEQEDEVRELQALDLWNAENAGKIGLTTEQYKELTKAAQDRNTAENKIEADEKKWQQEQAAALLETTKLWDQYNQLVGVGAGTAFDTQVDAIDRWAEDLEAKMQKAGTDTDEFYTALDAVWRAKLGALVTGTKAAIDANTNDTKAGLQQQADLEYARYQDALTHVGVWSDGTIEKFHTTYTAAQAAADAWGGDNAAWIDSLVKKNQTLVDSINATAAAQKAASGFFLTNAQLGFVNPFIPGSTGYLPPQPRALGGPVSAGQAYTVNENTPNSEIFIPSTSGYITPGMGSLGPVGSMGITVAPTMIIQSLTPGDPKTVEYVRQAADKAIISSLRNLVRMSRA